MPVQINEIVADVEVTPTAPAVEATAGDDAARADALEALQRRQQQQAERLAAWGRDD